MVHRGIGIILLASVLWVPVASAEPQGETPPRAEVYDIDRAHSILEFTIRLGGLTKVRGTFDRYQGAILYDESNIEKSSVNVVIQTESINTSSKERDDHLRSADFFDAEKFPSIKFQSRHVEKTEEGFLAVGTLKIHGVTKEFSMPFRRVHPVATDPFGNKRVTFEAHVRVDRKEFGVNGPQFWSEALSDEVEIELIASARRWNFDHLGFGSRDKTSIGEVLLETIKNEGIEAARKKYHSLRETHSEDYNFGLRGMYIAGMRLLQAGKFQEAEFLLEFSIQEYADDIQSVAALHRRLAELHLRKGDLEQAVSYCEKAVELNPRNIHAVELLRYLKSS